MDENFCCSRSAFQCYQFWPNTKKQTFLIVLHYISLYLLFFEYSTRMHFCFIWSSISMRGRQKHFAEKKFRETDLICQKNRYIHSPVYDVLTIIWLTFISSFNFHKHCTYIATSLLVPALFSLRLTKQVDMTPSDLEGWQTHKYVAPVPTVCNHGVIIYADTEVPSYLWFQRTLRLGTACLGGTNNQLVQVTFMNQSVPQREHHTSPLQTSTG
jgi:hypothetical protein